MACSINKLYNCNEQPNNQHPNHLLWCHVVVLSCTVQHVRMVLYVIVLYGGTLYGVVLHGVVYCMVLFSVFSMML